MSETDAALVARVLSGDQSAYDELVRRHFSASFAIARALTATREDAEDACQDAFTRGFFRLDGCREPARFGAWMGQIVRRRAHNLRAYQALRRCSSIDQAPDSPARERTERVAEDLELDRALAMALRRLSPIRRRIVMRFDVDGWTHEQIAADLGLSLTMSRRHLSDARAQLRGILTGLGYGDGEGEGDD